MSFLYLVKKEVCLNITINLKIPGYAPKYALQFKKDLKNRAKEDKKIQTLALKVKVRI